RRLRAPAYILRRQAALERLLVRLKIVAPSRWALKGGLALETRLGEHARVSVDLDADHRYGADAARSDLQRAALEDRGEHFGFLLVGAEDLRDAIPADVRKLIRMMSEANPLWGRRASTVNCASWASTSVRPASASTWPGTRSRHRRRGAHFWNTPSGILSLWISLSCRRSVSKSSMSSWRAARSRLWGRVLAPLNNSRSEVLPMPMAFPAGTGAAGYFRAFSSRR